MTILGHRHLLEKLLLRPHELQYPKSAPLALGPSGPHASGSKLHIKASAAMAACGLILTSG